ncbi:MAG: NADH oxidoreductase (quinone) subunit F [Spirochaetes bacterium RBG_16_49_21]|nr:MAG: NADH oxidoreductase (quinone) subunit F [Spirochaetes bacterium RBG_16_49_21]
MAERPLTGDIRPGEGPPRLTEYERRGGYAALKKALKQMDPAGVAEEVKRSGLRGRGGAGFPTGAKWSFVPMGTDAPEPKYLVANGDEMEPGTFKDRYLLEGNPHQLIEGMIIAAFAIQASVAFIFIREEYREACAALTRALAEAFAAGYLGGNILGSGFNLDMKLHVSAGRYMCGEETGLINALEGRRAVPRWKPPYPQTAGLWGKPTVVNNIETLCCVPHIVLKGAEYFKGLSRTGEGGTKLYGVSGKVKNPGCWELPMGTSIREILEEHAGGMMGGFKLKGLLPGGASTDFLLEEHLDVNMDFESVAKAGSRMGTGTIIVLDDRTCPVGFIHNLQKFFSRESCGWCTPCREGLAWVEKTLAAIEEGRGTREDIGILEFHVRLLAPGRTFCALAPGAMEPLGSGLKFFRDDFDRHISAPSCPWR